jgi:hypothetical protein
MKKIYGILCAFVALVITACTLDGANVVGPAGGFVFYDKGRYSDGWRYMEAAPENAGKGEWERAKELCEKYRLGGYDDWLLPDIDALKKMLGGKHGGKPFNDGVYWSSSEEGSSAWGVQNGDSDIPSGNSFSSGKNKAPDTYSKTNEYWARPVRRF